MRGGEGKGRDVKGWGGKGEREKNEGSRIYDEREEVKERGGKRRK